MEEQIQDKQSRVEEFVANPRRAVWTLSLPVMMGMAVYTFYNLTDMYFVGKLGGEALAALAFNMPVVFLALGIIFGLGTGATSAIARALGAGQKRVAEDAARQTILLGLGFAVALIVAVLTLKHEIMSSLGATGEVTELSVRYFEVAVPGFLFIVLNVCFRSILTGEGNTRKPMALQAMGTILNIFLDPVLIFWAGLGIAGAAWATLISQTLVLLAFLFYIFVHKGSYLNITSARFGLTRATVSDILRVGLPSSASMMMMSLAGVFFNRIVSVFGSEAVAGLGVGGRIDSIFFMPVLALGTSQVTLAGMFLGAKRVDLVRQMLHYTVLRGELMALAFGVFFYLFAPQLCGMFADDEHIQAVAVTYVRTIVFVFPFMVVSIISGRVFQGLGSGIPTMFITILRVVIISVPLAYAMTRFMGLGLQAVWWSIVIAGVVAALVGYTWVLRRISATERSSLHHTTAPTSPEHAVQT